jgi:hypothetical protein
MTEWILGVVPHEPAEPAMRASALKINRLITELFLQHGLTGEEHILCGQQANDGTGDAINVALSKLVRNLERLVVEQK